MLQQHLDWIERENFDNSQCWIAGFSFGSLNRNAAINEIDLKLIDLLLFHLNQMFMISFF